MTAPAHGIPEGLVDFDTSGASVTLRADAGVYPLEALYGAAYVFIDRCFVLLDRPSEDRWSVTLSLKNPAEDDAERLRGLVGEFGNELLACAWRTQLTAQNRVTVEAVAVQAMAGALGPPSLDDLEAFDFSDEAFDDPLGIATSWEEKHGKKTAKGDDEGT